MTSSIDHLSRLDTNEDSPRERVPREMAEQFEGFRHDADLLELVARLASEREIEVSDPTESEASFMAATQAAFDFRKGKKREELEGGDLSQEVKDLTEKLIDKYDMRRNTEPKNPDVDATLILGGAGMTPRTRLEYALDLEEQGKLREEGGAMPPLVMVGGERPVDMERDKNGETELDRAGLAGYNFSGEPAVTEFDLMRNTVARKLDIADDEWEQYDGDDPTVPHDEGFHTAWRVARAEHDGREIVVTSAPMLDEDRYLPTGQPRNRANTVDSLIFAAQFLRIGRVDGGRFGIVTNAVFVPFQDADAKKALAKYDIDVETVGMTREYSGLPDWPGGDVYYIQELLSAIRQTKFARDRLQEDES